MEFLSSILAEITKDPVKNYIVIPVKRHVGYAFSWEAKVERLQDETNQLKNKTERMHNSVDEAKRKGDEIYSNAITWLDAADKAIEEAQQLIHGQELAVHERCLIGVCPNLKTRYQLSKKADRKALAINKLNGDEEKLGSVSFSTPPKQLVAPSLYAGEALPSRISILNGVMVALKDSKCQMIGVYGMGGVGKTTLAKEVHRQAQDDKLFDVVIFVAVSQMPEIRRIQSEIGEVLGLDLKEEGLLVRANKLHKRLEKEKKIFIILDDMWNQLKLEEVGIPFGNDHKGCKIFLTSRSKDVCLEMGAEKPFSLNVLLEEEAWRLFEKNLAEIKDKEFHATATEISRKCAGLPLLIIKVANDLKKREELHAWKDTSNRLSQFGNLDARVSSVLKSSYDNLRDDGAKQFFLLCGLFGQSNINIQYLLRYSFGLNLFNTISTLENARHRVLTLIDDLKAECLLMEGDMDGYVKMHDLVRDTAISILSNEHHSFIGKSGADLRNWPDKDCTRISLPYCKIPETPESLECPNAELLVLLNEDVSLKIPDSFFTGVKKLKALDVSGMYFASLPSSLGFLINLRTLCLHKCKFDDVTVIGVLKQLWVLSLEGSETIQLPKEMEQLTQLKSLDLTGCYSLTSIPANSLSKLDLLEELYMDSFYEWDAEGNISLTELLNLSHLTTLELRVPSCKMIPETLFSKFIQLQRYKIKIGDYASHYVEHVDCRISKWLRLETYCHLEHEVKMLLTDSEIVELKNVKGIESVLHLDMESFPKLRLLKIERVGELCCLFNPKTERAPSAFPILESLFLRRLDQLETLWCGRLADGCFNKLRILDIFDCGSLDHLFSFSAVRNLSQLQELHVSYCENIRALFVQGSEEVNIEVIELPQLLRLELKNLPELKKFCTNEEELASGCYIIIFRFKGFFSQPGVFDSRGLEKVE